MRRLGFAFSTGSKAQCSPYADHILQEERLWIADPKAIHHILQATNYLYQKPPHLLEILESILDKGLVSVEGELSHVSHVVQPIIVCSGDVHKRQRKVMASSFGLGEAKALYPYFSRGSDAVSHCPSVFDHERPS